MIKARYKPKEVNLKKLKKYLEKNGKQTNKVSS